MIGLAETARARRNVDNKEAGNILELGMFATQGLSGETRQIRLAFICEMHVVGPSQTFRIVGRHGE